MIGAATTTALDAAHEYLPLGVSLIPVLPGEGKQPALPSWKVFQNRAAQEAEIDAWFGSAANLNIGMVTGAISGVVVLDADNEDAVAYCKKRGLWSPIRVKTGRGYHMYFRHPGGEVRNRAKLFGVKGVDLRGDGGYVVIPPSVHHTGRVYSWEIDPGFEWEDMPVWSPIQEVTPENAEKFVLDLSDVTPEGQPSVADRITDPLHEGEGRNMALTEYAGEMVAKGLAGPSLEDACRRFQREKFATPLPEQEFQRTLRSVVEIDRRNHPENWDHNTGQRVTEVRPQAAPGRIPGLNTTSEILTEPFVRTQYLIEPLLQVEGITQVAGYSGHGKSMVTLLACWNLALGRSCGRFFVREAKRVLYLDFDMSRSQLRGRFEALRKGFGDPGANLMTWATSRLGRQEFTLDIRTKQGQTNLALLINEVHPDVVVIDNLRTALPGMKEADSNEWSMINSVCLQMRNAGISVIMAHHTNKMQHDAKGNAIKGKEAGSTNQLTVLDTQIYVERLSPESTEWLELNRHTETYETIRDVYRINFSDGKIRDRDHELHNDFAMATAMRPDGSIRVVAPSSNRQKAVIMASWGTSIGGICEALRCRKDSVEAWIAGA